MYTLQISQNQIYTLTMSIPAHATWAIRHRNLAGWTQEQPVRMRVMASDMLLLKLRKLLSPS